MSGWEEEQYAYVTTKGRRTGRPHRIEIWFGAAEDTIFLLSGGGDRSDWVKNLRADGAVQVRIGGRRWHGRARVVEDPEEDLQARRLLATKYEGWREGRGLSTWARTALPVAVDLEEIG